MMVKICGVTSLKDALAAATYGAAAVGFNFYSKSPRSVPPEAAYAIGRRLPEEVLRVGVFVNEPKERVAEIAEIAGLNIVQLHGEETAEDFPPGLRVWKAIRVTDEFAPSALDRWPEAEAFLLDTPSDQLRGGTGLSFDWRRAAGLSRRVIVAGGLDASNVAEAIRIARPWGVDVCSRIETRPGVKDLQKMAAFLAAVKTS
ncbi:MAG: phosphoribosylanthranilate isomerase [Bryobacteraceae bacterium]